MEGENGLPRNPNLQTGEMLIAGVVPLELSGNDRKPVVLKPSLLLTVACDCMLPSACGSSQTTDKN